MKDDPDSSLERQQKSLVRSDRELSYAQESGLDPGWFEYELKERTKWCDFPALVTTWTDGENGGWFRTTNIEGGFWGYFYRPILDKRRAGTLGFTPVHISEYLDRFPPTEEVEVHRGAWNTGHHWGGDFSQWTGSLLQKRGWDEIGNASAYYHKVKRTFDERQGAVGNPDEVRHLIIKAYDHLLTAETSCNFFWESRWVHRSFDDLEQTYHLLDLAMSSWEHREDVVACAQRRLADPGFNVRILPLRQLVRSYRYRLQVDNLRRCRVRVRNNVQHKKLEHNDNDRYPERYRDRS